MKEYSRGIYIPRSILQRRNLNCRDKLVFGCLLNYKGMQGCFPGQKTLADDLSCSIDTICSSLQRLKRRGIIKIIRVGKKCTNRYEFISNPETVNLQNHQKCKKNPRENTILTSDSEKHPRCDSGDIQNPKYINNKKDKKIENHSKRVPGLNPGTSSSKEKIISTYKELWQMKNGRTFPSVSCDETDTAEELSLLCSSERPNDPLGLFRERAGLLMNSFEINSLKALRAYWRVDGHILNKKKVSEE